MTAPVGFDEPYRDGGCAKGLAYAVLVDVLLAVVVIAVWKAIA